MGKKVEKRKGAVTVAIERAYQEGLEDGQRFEDARAAQSYRYGYEAGYKQGEADAPEAIFRSLKARRETVRIPNFIGILPSELLKRPTWVFSSPGSPRGAYTQTV